MTTSHASFDASMSGDIEESLHIESPTQVLRHMYETGIYADVVLKLGPPAQTSLPHSSIAAEPLDLASSSESLITSSSPPPLSGATLRASFAPSDTTTFVLFPAHTWHLRLTSRFFATLLSSVSRKDMSVHEPSGLPMIECAAYPSEVYLVMLRFLYLGDYELPSLGGTTGTHLTHGYLPPHFSSPASAIVASSSSSSSSLAQPTTTTMTTTVSSLREYTVARIEIASVHSQSNDGKASSANPGNNVSKMNVMVPLELMVAQLLELSLLWENDLAALRAIEYMLKNAANSDTLVRYYQSAGTLTRLTSATKNDKDPRVVFSSTLKRAIEHAATIRNIVAETFIRMSSSFLPTILTSATLKGSDSVLELHDADLRTLLDSSHGSRLAIRWDMKQVLPMLTRWTKHKKCDPRTLRQLSEWRLRNAPLVTLLTLQRSGDLTCAGYTSDEILDLIHASYASSFPSNRNVRVCAQPMMLPSPLPLPSSPLSSSSSSSPPDYNLDERKKETKDVCVSISPPSSSSSSSIPSSPTGTSLVSPVASLGLTPSYTLTAIGSIMSSPPQYEYVTWRSPDPVPKDRAATYVCTIVRHGGNKTDSALTQLNNNRMLFGIVPEGVLADSKDAYINPDALMFYSANTQVFRNGVALSNNKEEILPEGAQIMMTITPIPSSSSLLGGTHNITTTISGGVAETKTASSGEKRDSSVQDTGTCDVKFSVSLSSNTFYHKSNVRHMKPDIVYYPAVSFVVPGFIVTFKRTN
jgi:hypothetical protein